MQGSDGLAYKPALYLLLQKKKMLGHKLRVVISDPVFIYQLHITLHASSGLLALFRREGNCILFLLN